MTAKWQRTLLVAATLATVAVPWAGAQGPGQPGRPPPGGGMPPGMGGQFQAWRQWGDKHRSLMTLGRTVRGLGMLDRDPTTKLSAAQAKTIVPVLRAWRHKPTMTDAQAAQVNHQITATLKPAQIQKLAARRGPGGGPGGRPPGGGPRPGGFGRPPAASAEGREASAARRPPAASAEGRPRPKRSTRSTRTRRPSHAPGPARRGNWTP